MDVLHCALWVADVDRTLAFYCDEIGLEKTREFVGGDGARNVFVAGEGEAELQFKHDPDRTDPLPEPAGIDHVAFEVGDTDAMVEQLVEDGGATLRRGPLDSEGASARIAFVEDPDGYGVELIAPFE